MSELPGDLQYTNDHEWLRRDEDGHVTIGITDHAQEMLGDLVFVELPEVGTELGVGSECAVVESVKAASDVYAPIGGTVTEINEAMDQLGYVPDRHFFGLDRGISFIDSMNRTFVFFLQPLNQLIASANPWR